ncbi:MAG TPA: hypothetical protein VGI66_13015 [Streptosporangiaceae bacterium]
MVKARFGIGAASVALVAVGLLAGGALTSTAAGAASSSCGSSGKCYLTTVAPQSAVAGVSQAFSVTVTNEATTQRLGSVQVTAPPGFVVTGATGGTASYTAGSALFLNLGLTNGQSATLIVDATAPCSGGTSPWGIKAKQSNQFNGSGNDFVMDPASSLAATVSGSCSLAFLKQPNGTAVGAPITTEVGPGGSPVSVEVLDGAGHLLTTSTAAVTVAIGSNPGSGTLSGTTTVDASAGVASFPDLSINQTGTGYSLVATSTGITSATSTYFDIWGVLQSCSGSACSGSPVPTKTTSGTVTTSSATSGQFLGVALGGVSFSCGSSYQPVSDPLSFDVLSQSGAADSSAQFAVSLQVSKQVVQSSGHPGASSWQICFGSNVPFPVLPGTTAGTTTIGGVTYQTGLLPDCNNTQTNAPCVQARTKDGAGNVIVTFLASGDAFGRM